jgi:uncharacterized protein DUF4157
MAEYAQKTRRGASQPDGAHVSIRRAARLAPSASAAAAGAEAGQQTLQAVLNHGPAVQAVAQLKRALNHGEGGLVAQRVEQEETPVQGAFETAQRVSGTNREAAPNRTGMPDDLKAGVESLSGLDLSDVRVHANSNKPAQLDALAYAQGSDIHVAPGQERHLAHEAWHVVQQRQGRVAPTMQIEGVQINDDGGLEGEADRMGTQASQMKKDPGLRKLQSETPQP